MINTVNLNSWVEELERSISTYTIDNLPDFKNYYLDKIVSIVFYNHFGKIQRLNKSIEELISFLAKRKKLNRLEEIKSILTKLNLKTESVDNIISNLSALNLNNEIQFANSAISVMNNFEVFAASKFYRKILIDSVSLIDPLLFIEGLYKNISTFFDSEEHKEIIYKYCLTTFDNELIEAVNIYLAGRFEEIKLNCEDENKHDGNSKPLQTDIDEINSEDYLLNIANLREKLVDGCDSKQEYVNTLFEIAKNYRGAGKIERAYFFAIIVQRLSPGYRNVEAMLKL